VLEIFLRVPYAPSWHHHHHHEHWCSVCLVSLRLARSHVFRWEHFLKQDFRFAPECRIWKRSVDIVRSRTKTTELLVIYSYYAFTVFRGTGTKADTWYSLVVIPNAVLNFMPVRNISTFDVTGIGSLLLVKTRLWGQDDIRRYLKLTLFLSTFRLQSEPDILPAWDMLSHCLRLVWIVNWKRLLDSGASLVPAVTRNLSQCPAKSTHRPIENKYFCWRLSTL
jgi:hypothetical protein